MTRIFGAMLVMQLEELFQVRAKLALHDERSHAWLSPNRLSTFLVVMGLLTHFSVSAFLSATTAHTCCVLPSHLVSSCISCCSPLSQQPRSLSHHSFPYFSPLLLCQSWFWVADIIVFSLLKLIWSLDRNLH